MGVVPSLCQLPHEVVLRAAALRTANQNPTTKNARHLLYEFFLIMSSLQDVAEALPDTGLCKVSQVRKLLRAARADETPLGDLPLHISATVINSTVS